MKTLINNLKSLTVPTAKKTCTSTVFVIVSSLIVAALVAALSFAGSELSLAVINLISKAL